MYSLAEIDCSLTVDTAVHVSHVLMPPPSLYVCLGAFRLVALPDLKNHVLTNTINDECMHSVRI